MRKLFLLLPLVALLTACQSKKDICAQAVTGQISTKGAAKKLGITRPGRYGLYRTVVEFCEFYKS